MATKDSGNSIDEKIIMNALCIRCGKSIWLNGRNATIRPCHQFSRGNRFFSSITPEERIAFFRLWTKHHYSGKSVYYDVTSVSSYASNLPEVERGYNRDHEDLAQFNLGMFCEEDTRMPL